MICKYIVVTALAIYTTTSVPAATLWYNGDPIFGNLVNGLSGSIDTGTRALVFDDFVVPAGVLGWNISSVFIAEAYTGFETLADWQIRSGVSSGNQGTLVASGTGSATVTLLPPVNTNVAHRVEVFGLNVFLLPGTYWLGVSPIGSGLPDDYRYIWATSGANAVGTPAGNDGNAFIDGPSFGVMAPTSSVGPYTDYSMGVTGNVVAPEPSTVLLGLIGIAGITMHRIRK